MGQGKCEREWAAQDGTGGRRWVGQPGMGQEKVREGEGN